MLYSYGEDLPQWKMNFLVGACAVQDEISECAMPDIMLENRE